MMKLKILYIATLLQGERLRSANADPAFVSSLNDVKNLIWITRKTELFNVASCP